MAIKFVCRSPYENLTGRHVRTLPFESLLEFFQHIWEPARSADLNASQVVEELVGVEFFGFNGLIDAISDFNLLAPKTNRDLKALIEKYVRPEGHVKFQAQALQVFDDDDELELCYFLIAIDIVNAIRIAAPFSSTTALCQLGWRIAQNQIPVRAVCSLPGTNLRLPNMGQGCLQRREARRSEISHCGIRTADYAEAAQVSRILPP